MYSGIAFYDQARTSFVRDYDGGVLSSINFSDPTDRAHYWKYNLVPGDASKYTAQFGYDSVGRATDVYKLQKTTATPWSYVQTHTVYNDSTGWWGEPSSVTEDYGTGKLNRETDTLEYDAFGRATKVQDAAGHKFQTSYDGDGVVQWVKQYNAATSLYDIPVVTYTYGSSGLTNGMVTEVVDNLSGDDQTLTYSSATGGSHGQVSQVSETVGSTTSSETYGYSAAGDRSEADYTTPNGTTKWGYADYIPQGSPESAKRLFQTLNKLDSGGAVTAEEFHYQYDSSGRLLEAAFDQSEQSGHYYSSSYPAASRARAHYEYEPGGRLLTLTNWWDTFSSGSYASQALLANGCDYDSTLGLKSHSYLYSLDSSTGNFKTTPDRTETYGYDANLDYLTSAAYSDTSTTVTWGYDAAGNRTSDSSNTGTWTYDNLNRMSASPGFTYENDVLGNRSWRNHASGTGGQQMGWDALNRMTKCYGVSDGAQYAYRADGMRVRKVGGFTLAWHPPTPGGAGYYTSGQATNYPTTRYFYDGQMPMEEDSAYNASIGLGSGTGSPPPPDVTRYGLGARGIDWVSFYNHSTSTTTISYPLYDCHGNQIATIPAATSYPTIGNQKSFDVWGGVRTGSTSGTPHQRYCGNLGHQQDDESGLIYMRARYYEPTTGRFVSQDPSENDWNWYTYCAGDPVNYSDQSGRWKIPGGYEIFLDFDIRGGIGDVHVKLDGREIISCFADGIGHHIKEIVWPKELLQNLIRSAASGDARSLNLLNGLKEGMFGFDPEVLTDLFSKGSGMAFMAYTSLDAYAQEDPLDFIDTMRTIVDPTGE